MLFQRESSPIPPTLPLTMNSIGYCIPVHSINTTAGCLYY